MKLEKHNTITRDNSNVNTCVAVNAHRDILNQILYVVRRKMCFHLFLLFEPIVYPTTCV